MPNPTYEQVSAHTTGHAEVVKIDYDPSQVSLERLLKFFWQAHDPTQVGGQGEDMGPNYRSIILYTGDSQKTAAEKSRDEAQKSLRAPITTQIVPADHILARRGLPSGLFQEHSDQAYCSVVIAPKISKLEKLLRPPVPAAEIEGAGRAGWTHERPARPLRSRFRPPTDPVCPGGQSRPVARHHRPT